MAERRSKSSASRAGSAAEADAPSFEEALEKLESIVSRLEEGDLPLEEALASFEQGVALSRRCASQLDEAERRIEVLSREGERWVTRPLEDAEGDE